MNDLEQRVSGRLEALASDLKNAPVGAAVSGGSDSTALMHLAVATLGAERVRVATVNHHLRPEAADEAESVAAQAKALGLKHEVLHWENWDGRGNLQNAARLARQALLSAWAEKNGLAAVCLGHTKDDQAETVLLRLARGSGVDGLSGMAERRVDREGLVWLRPLLSENRADLRNWLTGKQITWAEDPSNSDPRFDRVRARRLLDLTADLGLDADGLVETAHRMAAARRVLADKAVDAAMELATIDHGAIWLGDGFWDLPDDTRWRLLAGALSQVSGQAYRPRFKALLRAEAHARQGQTNSLHGCLIVPEQASIRIQPEPKRLEFKLIASGATWHGWKVLGPSDTKSQIGPLGEHGAAQTKIWRIHGLSHRLAQSLPAVWSRQSVVTLPSLEPDTWRAQLTWNKEDFCRFMQSH
ncbi:MAG: tRNA lysidine(34) synthetase TilS [Pseudomonadota bacterium]